MDAVEFLKEHKRMCNQIDCESCPLHSNGGCDIPISFSKSLDLRECVEAVEQWAKEHPAKTRQSEFLERYPDARVVTGILSVCPYNLGLIDVCESENRKLCCECRRDFWMQEV